MSAAVGIDNDDPSLTGDPNLLVRTAAHSTRSFPFPSGVAVVVVVVCAT